MKIQKSAEDYLEMILRLHETKGYARAIDISYGLSVTKPSVSVAMRNLRENGYITVEQKIERLTLKGGLRVESVWLHRSLSAMLLPPCPQWRFPL